MKYLVVYYSRSGKIEALAKKISNVKNADLVPIKDNINWNGFFGFLRAGFNAMTKKTTKIEPINVDYNNFDQMYLCTPIWAGNIPPAVREFKKSLQDYKGQVTIIYSCQNPNHQNYKNNLSKEFSGSTVLGFCEKVHDEIKYESI